MSGVLFHSSESAMLSRSSCFAGVCKVAPKVHPDIVALKKGCQIKPTQTYENSTDRELHHTTEHQAESAVQDHQLVQSKRPRNQTLTARASGSGLDLPSCYDCMRKAPSVPD